LSAAGVREKREHGPRIKKNKKRIKKNKKDKNIE
jgi:hypothetical protein